MMMPLMFEMGERPCDGQDCSMGRHGGTDELTSARLLKEGSMRGLRSFPSSHLPFFFKLHKTIKWGRFTTGIKDIIHQNLPMEYTK